MGFIWYNLLYRPLVNILILLYNTISYNNLGIAVVWLTVLVRIALLPLSIIVERNKSVYEALEDRLDKIHASFAKDPVMEREATREILKKYKIKPLANALLLGIQLLILVLLYQVFIGGINLSQDVLYDSVMRPATIDTTFIGIFDIATRNWIVSLVVSAVLFVTLRIEYVGKKSLVNSKNAFYIYVFPVLTFLILWWLPSVKALFIITSMFLSQVIHFVQQPVYNAFFGPGLAKIKAGGGDDKGGKGKPPATPAEPKPAEFKYVGSPWDELRKRARQK